MTQPFLGQISLFGFNFAPRNWALCQGQIVPIQQFTALFSLLGTYYGGNGTSTFGLPDLQGRVPLSQGTSTTGQTYVIGEQSGSPNASLDQSTLPSHNHPFNASTDKTTVGVSSGNVLGKAQLGSAQKGFTKGLMYSPNAPGTVMAPNSLTPYGGSQQHNNMQPYLTLNYCIALNGVYPARN